MDKISEQLKDFALSVRYDELPSETIHEAKRRMIDSLGIAMGGYLEDPCKIARALAMESVGRPGATVLGSRHKASPEMAAFANGTMVHSQDYMDTYLSKEACHPSDNISGILAIAEQIGAGGRPVIEGIVVAYEVMCRLCDAAGVRERGWDHVVYGVIASAVAVGKVLGLNEEQMRQAISLAAVPNGALRQTRVGEIPMWKACAPANAARNGLFAARLAALGMTSTGLPFDGTKAFQKQISGPLELAPFGGKGRPYMINQTYIKQWPVQYNTQAGIEAALALRSRFAGIHEVDSIMIDISDVGLDLTADTPAKWDPMTRETADHSLPYIVVSALSDGQVTRATFDELRFRNPEMLAMVKKVTVRKNESFSREYPDKLSVSVEVKTKDGRNFVQQVDFPKGHPKNRMSDTEVENKFQRLARTVLSDRQIEAAIEPLWHLENISDIGNVLKHFVV